MELPNLLPFSFLLFLLLWPQPPSAHASTSYFIVCGTSAATTDDGQSFTGDADLPAGVKLSTKSSKPVADTSNSNQPSSSLYKTARVFTSNAFYQFDTPDAGTYLLRLHFFAFSSSDNLTSAQFNVSANGCMLLPSFTGKESSSSPVKTEFLLPVETGEDLKVSFIPTGSSGFAFVNAIEVISAPLYLTDINTPLKITPTGGYNGSFRNLGSKVLRPIYRVNVGSNSNVSSSEDILRRIWWLDDPYLVAGKGDTEKLGPVPQVNFRNENGTAADAPNLVYNTARGWKNSNSTNLLNATWRFSVSRSSNYFVRVHLCDILSSAYGEIKFNLYFYGNFAWKVYPWDVTQRDQSPAPFCLDFVVKSDDMGFINLTIGSRNDSLSNGAFLNGLEIMEFVTGSAIEPIITSKGGDVALIAGLVAGGLTLVVILVAGFVWFSVRRRKRARPVEEFDWPLAALNGGSESKTNSDKTASRSSLSSLPSLHLRIPFAVIQQVTNDFDESLVIGRGGFGKVYRGVLKNGEKVAVKRSDSKHGQGLPEFQTEITVLSKIRHRHLVSLIGYCDENGEMILVYEFMEKGTLRDHLYGSSSAGLPWKQRLEICIGAAKGLHYLHTGSTGGIIHRDVKSTNILLDENYLAKVADFGLSRIGALDQETHISTLVKGTFGYLDPEYYQRMQLTEKSDVYSFGVLLLEVLCARPVLDTSLPRDQVNLADWAMSCKGKGELEMIIDPSLAGQIDGNSLKKFVETTEKCLRESGADRPPMSDVLWDLEYILQLQKFGGQEGGFGETTSTTDASFNLPMLAVPCFSTTSLATGEESGAPIDDVSGLCGDSGEVSTGKLKLDDSM